MDVVHRISTLLDAKLKEVHHWINLAFFDIWVFAEVVVGVE
jgi:hypothetical protein